MMWDFQMQPNKQSNAVVKIIAIPSDKNIKESEKCQQLKEGEANRGPQKHLGLWTLNMLSDSSRFPTQHA